MLPVVLLLGSTSVFAAHTDDWITTYERSNYLRTPRYKETVAYCKRLASASPWIHYTSFGVSPQGRDLPLLILDKNGNFTPEAVRQTGNAVVLIQAGIHSGEIDGKDAGLMLARDIAIHKKYASLLDHVTVLFNPIFNVDGHERFSKYNRINQNGPEEMGWRVTAQNLNLNRDYLKADAPEMQAWLRLYTRWLPEFFVDCHVTDGADYQYTVTYALEIFGNMDPELTRWTRDEYLAPLKRQMKQSGFPIIRYNAYRRRHDPKSGLVSWAAGPRFSEGYTAIQNRPGLLIETHMLKPYRKRVTGTYEMLRHTLELVGTTRDDLRRACRDADARCASGALVGTNFPLSFRLGPDSVMVDFLGVKYDVVKSDLTGGRWFQYHPDRPVTWRIPYFNTQVPAITATLPEAYLVPPEWTRVIDRLQLHGVAVDRLRTPVTLAVSTVRFSGARWAQHPWEGRHRMSFTARDTVETRTYPAGTALIDMHQRAARVAAHILEPNAPDSYVAWGFFDTIFEQKEYVESYVMERLARKMLAQNPNLRDDFHTAIASDSALAANPGAIINWFYRRSPWWDARIGAYPVGRIRDRAQVRHLLSAVQ